jgi:4,5-dihydroxyphthalate decarboxylase
MMPALRLSAAFSRNPMTAALHDGTVAPEGVSWTVSALHPSEMFWRQLRFAEFDVSEMSLSSLAISVAKGDRSWVALPIFTTRRFFHTAIMVRSDAGIDTPQQLADKRVGVPEYQQTAAVWSRGALRHEFGVQPEDLRWYMERAPERSHGGATSFAPPAGVELSYIPPPESIGGMLASGGLDAALVYIADANLVDRTRASAAEHGRVRPLFADPVAEGIRYYRATGLLPVNHCVVIRAELAAQQPWLALNLMGAFIRAKDKQAAALAGLLGPYRQLGGIPAADVARVTEMDPLPYGVTGQRQTLETLMTYLVEQELAPRKVDLAELFAASTLDI